MILNDKSHTLKINEVLKVSEDMLHIASAQDSVLSAVETMSKYNRGAILVVQDNQLIGMLTFYDVIRYLAKQKGNIGDTRIGEIMNDNPITITPDTSINEVQRIMINHHLRYLPVLEQGAVVGVVTLTDVTRAMIQAQQFENTLLKEYIKNINSED